MDPTVEAAWIAAGVAAFGIAGTVVVAVVAAKITKRTNSETLEAAADNLKRTLDAARDDRLWEKKTLAYEEIIAYLLYIQAKRRLLLRRGFITYNKEYEEASDRRVGDYKPASWWELQARLAAYGSLESHAAFEASVKADNEVGALHFRLDDLAQQSKDARSSGASQPDINEIQATRNQLEVAHKQAGEADQAVIKLMRNELNEHSVVTPPRA